jgi:hypothetical protein
MDKLSIYTTRQAVIGKMSNLMGNPLRAAIIECIAKEKSCFENEFLEKHNISITVLKKNIRALNKGGLLVRYTFGRNRANVYKVNWDKFIEYKILFDEFYYDLRGFQDSKFPKFK